MRKSTLFLALAATVSAAGASAESELDLSISSDVVGIEYSIRDGLQGVQWAAGAKYNDDHNATLFSGTFNVTGKAVANEQTYTGLGVKAVIHDTDVDTAGSLALGGSASYQPAQLNGFGLEGQVYYAPEVLNTGDADEFYELVARVTYAVHPQGRVFVGWTNATVEYDDALVREVEIENAFNMGFTLLF